MTPAERVVLVAIARLLVAFVRDQAWSGGKDMDTLLTALDRLDLEVEPRDIRR